MFIPALTQPCRCVCCLFSEKHYTPLVSTVPEIGGSTTRDREGIRRTRRTNPTKPTKPTCCETQFSYLSWYHGFLSISVVVGGCVLCAGARVSHVSEVSSQRGARRVTKNGQGLVGVSGHVGVVRASQFDDREHPHLHPESSHPSSGETKNPSIPLPPLSRLLLQPTQR